MRKLILGYCAGFISGIGAYIAYTKYKERKKQIDEENERLFNEINSDIDNLKKRRLHHLNDIQKEYDEDRCSDYPNQYSEEDFDKYFEENPDRLNDILRVYNLKKEKIEEIKKGVNDEVMVQLPEYMSEYQVNYIMSNVTPLSLSIEYKNALIELFKIEYKRKAFSNIDDYILFDACMEEKYSYIGEDIDEKISVGDILLHFAEQFEFDVDIDRTTYFGEVLDNIYEGNINSYLNTNYVNKICDEIVSGKRELFPNIIGSNSIKHGYDLFIYNRVNNA